MGTKKRAAVWGLGRFGGGRAALLFLARKGYELCILDRASRDELGPYLAELEEQSGQGFTLLREHEDSLDGVELLVVNPAIRPSHPLLAAAHRREIECTQELRLFLEAYPGRVIAVTGTNGKSTTAALLAAGLEAEGRDVLLGGNIGHSLLDDEDRWHEEQWAVLEISSFQASRLKGTSARIDALALCPFGIDHLDWHGDLEDYYRSKLALLDLLTEDAFVSLSAQNDAALQRLHANAALAPRLKVLGEDPRWPLVDEAGDLRYEGELLVSRRHPALSTRFLLEDAALALGVLGGLGFRIEDAARGCQEFEGLRSRMEGLGMREGVRFIDNGISTVAETSRLAIESIEGKVHWVVGGHPKSNDYSPHVEAADLASTVHLFGEAGPRLWSLLRKRHEDSLHEQLAGALESALASARPGDTILFSPAFSSHDQYPNFRERAREAREWWLGRRTGKDPNEEASLPT